MAEALGATAWRCWNCMCRHTVSGVIGVAATDYALDVVVMVCTCDRHDLLGKLLACLAREIRDTSARIVVVDSGLQSAEAVVRSAAGSDLIDYRRLEMRGLSEARNRALSAALEQRPRFLAFIDDDEWPEDGWIAKLVRTAGAEDADIVYGPKLPEFSEPPPAWVVDGGFFRYEGAHCATANVLLRASVVPGDEARWFQQEFNFIGGEDQEFLLRLERAGAKVAVAEDAIVREWTPPSRITLTYQMRCHRRDGAAMVLLYRLWYGRFAGFGRSLFYAARKMAYGLNHVFWSAIEPLRLRSAICDFAAGWGVLRALLGAPPRMYGQATEES